MKPSSVQSKITFQGQNFDEILTIAELLDVPEHILTGVKEVVRPDPRLGASAHHWTYGQSGINTPIDKSAKKTATTDDKTLSNIKHLASTYDRNKMTPSS